MSKSLLYEVVIVGAGPSGLTAALYTGRYRLKTLLVEKLTVGGQIILSPSIENFPGFPGGISTQELIERFRKQITSLDISLTDEEVLRIDRDKENKGALYNVKTPQKTYATKSVIIACGAKAKELGVEGEREFLGRGVSYCGTCDGPLFKGKDIIVVGGGDRALEEAVFLSGYANRVTLIHRRQQLRACGILEEKVRRIPKIKFILENTIEKIIGKKKVEAVKIKDLNSNVVRELPCQGIFIFVGIKPNTDFLKEQLEMDENGFIITDQQMRTSATGIFACGDCRKKTLYQVINACGEGAEAAHSARQYLNENY